MQYVLPANLEVVFHLVPPKYQGILCDEVYKALTQRSKDLGNISDGVWRQMCGEISLVRICKDEGDRVFRARLFGHDNEPYVPIALGKRILGLRMAIADDRSVAAEWVCS